MHVTGENVRWGAAVGMSGSSSKDEDIDLPRDPAVPLKRNGKMYPPNTWAHVCSSISHHRQNMVTTQMVSCR